MKSVAQRIKKDIEYFSALGEIYEQKGEEAAHLAAQETIAALEKLLQALRGRDHAGQGDFPLAA